MADRSKHALQLQTIAMMESMEVFFLERVAERDENQAENMDNVSRRYFYKSQAEDIYSFRASQRADYFAKLAAQEQHLANNMFLNVKHDEDLHAQLIHNMTMLQEQQDQWQQQLRAVHQGACAAKLLWTVCDVVEGTVDLQHKIDSEALELQHDLAQSSSLSHREYLEQFAAKILQGRAEHYNQTAQQLLQVADYWQQQARRDYLQGLPKLLERHYRPIHTTSSPRMDLSCT
jgi:hypothetical protein